ncbi:hypothetical protein ACIQFU_30660 [Streptomyces sp. NPDC093065]
MTDGTTVDVADEQIVSTQIILGIKILRDHLNCGRVEYGTGFYS